MINKYLRHKNEISNYKFLCSKPFEKMGIYHDGRIAPCCFFKDADPLIFNEMVDDIIDYFHHEKFVKIRKTFLNGDLPNGCRDCVNLVEVNKYGNSQIKTHLSSIESFKEYETVPREFMLHCFTNCNLACNFCDSTRSSKIRSLNNNTEQYRNAIIKQNQIVECVSNQIKNNKWNKNINLSLCGGEAFFDKTLDKIWEGIDSNKLKKISIVSNIAVPHETFKPKFNALQKNSYMMTASIDGTPTIHQYIRGCNWNNIHKNISIIPRDKLLIHFNLSIFNVGYIYDFYKQFIQPYNITKLRIFYSIGDSAINFLHPDLIQLYIKKYSNDIINKIQDINKMMDITLDFQVIFNTILNTKYNDGNWNRFCQLVNHFDKIKNTNILDIYPEFKDYWIYE